MKIKDMYNKNKPVISFEVFPPNKSHDIETIYGTVHELAKFNPDFISVTYGAGGSTRGNTVEIASLIKNKYNIFQNFRKVYKTYSLTLHFILI